MLSFIESNNLSHSEKCFGGAPSQCLSCNGTLHLDATLSRCVATCPVGHRENSTTHTCDACARNCRRCATHVNECSECKGGTLLHEGDCVSVCPPRYAPDALSVACAACDSCKLDVCAWGASARLSQLSSHSIFSPHYHTSDSVLPVRVTRERDSVHSVCTGGDERVAHISHERVVRVDGILSGRDVRADGRCDAGVVRGVPQVIQWTELHR